METRTTAAISSATIKSELGSQTVMVWEPYGCFEDSDIDDAYRTSLTPRPFAYTFGYRALRQAKLLDGTLSSGVGVCMVLEHGLTPFTFGGQYWRHGGKIWLNRRRGIRIRVQDLRTLTHK